MVVISEILNFGRLSFLYRNLQLFAVIILLFVKFLVTCLLCKKVRFTKAVTLSLLDYITNPWHTVGPEYSLNEQMVEWEGYKIQDLPWFSCHSGGHLSSSGQRETTEDVWELQKELIFLQWNYLGTWSQENCIPIWESDLNLNRDHVAYLSTAPVSCIHNVWYRTDDKNMIA